MKQITHIAIAKTYSPSTSIKAGDDKNEKQMKSNFYRGNLSTRKGEVSYFIPLLDKQNI